MPLNHFPSLTTLDALGITLHKRQYDILMSTLCGRSCVELAEKHNITRVRVRQLYYGILSKIYKTFTQYAIDNAKLMIENRELRELNKDNFEQYLQKQVNVNLDKLINDLKLTKRTKRCLTAINIVSIRDVLNKSEYDILSIPTLGVKCLIELKSMLAEMGLHFSS